MTIFTGTGRSGTGYYANLFGGTHEFNVTEKLVPLMEKYLKDSLYYSKKYPLTKELKLQIMNDFFEDIDTDNFIDSSNVYMHFLDVLPLIDKNVKIVLGVRDGKDFVKSALYRGWHMDVKRYRNLSMVPPQNHSDYLKFNEENPIYRMAWMWKYYNEIGINNLKKIDQKYWKIIKLENIVQSIGIEELESFTGIKSIQNKIKEKVNINKYNEGDFITECLVKNDDSRIIIPDKLEWTEEMDIVFDHVAGDLYQEFGYKSSDG